MNLSSVILWVLLTIFSDDGVARLDLDVFLTEKQCKAIAAAIEAQDKTATAKCRPAMFHGPGKEIG